MSGYTPGPWEVRVHNYANYREAHGIFRVGGNNPIIDGVWGRNLTESDANAKLVAMSPEMAEALLVALPYVEDALNSEDFKPGKVRAHVNQIREILEKAGVI